MKKIGYITAILLAVLLAFAIRIETRTLSLADILKINPQQIASLTLSDPESAIYTTTKNEEKILSFISHLRQGVYREIRGNAPSYLPMEATTIYLEGKGKTDFVIIFEEKIMINHTVYEVRNNPIDPAFLKNFYASISK